MEPEITTQPQEGNKKKVLVLIAVLVLILLGVAGVSIYNGNAPSQTAETQLPVVQVTKKSFTQEEKQMILENLAKTAFNTPASQKEKQRILSNLAKQSPATTISQEEKQKILANLAATAGQ